MKVALAQINSVVGDFSGNCQKILEFAARAENENCDLVIFPELALFGYLPADLLEREDLVEEQMKYVKNILAAKKLKIQMVFGAVTKAAKGGGKPYYNSALYKGSKNQIAHKELLPSYDVFDEHRFFRPGSIAKNIFKLKKQKALMLVCEDMWSSDRADYGAPLKGLAKNKFDFVMSINASPFSITKQPRRLNMAKQTAKQMGCPVIYVNMVGAQDEIIFDGGSFIMDAQGRVLAQAAFFKEDLLIYDLETGRGKSKKWKAKQISIPRRSEIENIKDALVLGIRDFAHKSGLSKIHFGLSGGIDSAVVACLAVEAIGAENVCAIALPGPFSADKSFNLAEELAQNLNCKFHSVSIESIYKEQLRAYDQIFGEQKFSVLHENLQARIRGGILMMYSNAENSMLVSTSNKSEMAAGYATLYGDMCGGLAPLADLLKKQVYGLAGYYNREKIIIPQEIIDRAPSAELRPNQKDQDSLPPYDVLDDSVNRMVTLQQRAKNTTDDWLLKKIAFSEFKRWQAPPILRITDHAFGRGRRWPISHRAYKK